MYIIDVINVQIKIKKKRGKIKKAFVRVWQNVADVCHESNYYLRTLKVVKF